MNFHCSAQVCLLCSLEPPLALDIKYNNNLHHLTITPSHEHSAIQSCVGVLGLLDHNYAGYELTLQPGIVC